MRESEDVQMFTDGPDDSFLQLPLLVSFDDLSPDVCAAIVRSRQLVIHTQAELLQQSVENLQHCWTCKHIEDKRFIISELICTLHWQSCH